MRSRRERKREGLSKDGGEQVKRSFGGRERVRGFGGEEVVQSMSGGKGVGDVGEKGAETSRMDRRGVMTAKMNSLQVWPL